MLWYCSILFYFESVRSIVNQRKKWQYFYWFKCMRFWQVSQSFDSIKLINHFNLLTLCLKEAGMSVIEIPKKFLFFVLSYILSISLFLLQTMKIIKVYSIFCLKCKCPRFIRIQMCGASRTPSLSTLNIFSFIAHFVHGISQYITIINKTFLPSSVIECPSMHRKITVQTRLHNNKLS